MHENQAHLALHCAQRRQQAVRARRWHGGRVEEARLRLQYGAHALHVRHARAQAVAEQHDQRGRPRVLRALRRELLGVKEHVLAHMHRQDLWVLLQKAARVERARPPLPPLPLPRPRKPAPLALLIALALQPPLLGELGVHVVQVELVEALAAQQDSAARPGSVANRARDAVLRAAVAVAARYPIALALHGAGVHADAHTQATPQQHLVARRRVLPRARGSLRAVRAPNVFVAARLAACPAVAVAARTRAPLSAALLRIVTAAPIERAEVPPRRRPGARRRCIRGMAVRLKLGRHRREPSVHRAEQLIAPWRLQQRVLHLERPQHGVSGRVEGRYEGVALGH